MKKTALLIISLLSLGVACASGCTETPPSNSDTENLQNYNLVQEEPDNENDNCKDGGCKDGRPEFRFVEPENRRMPPHKPHKRHDSNPPAHTPVRPETN